MERHLQEAGLHVVRLSERSEAFEMLAQGRVGTVVAQCEASKAGIRPFLDLVANLYPGVRRLLVRDDAGNKEPAMTGSEGVIGAWHPERILEWCHRSEDLRSRAGDLSV